MEDYQRRVIEEKRDLDEKAIKLSNFIGYSPLFVTISALEQELIREQCEVMWEYSEILGKRIEAFIQNNHKINLSLRRNVVIDSIFNTGSVD